MPSCSSARLPTRDFECELNASCLRWLPGARLRANKFRWEPRRRRLGSGHAEKSSSGQPYALRVVTGGQPASDLRAATAFEAGLIGLSAGLYVSWLQYRDGQCRGGLAQLVGEGAATAIRCAPAASSRRYCDQCCWYSGGTVISAEVTY